MPYRLTTLNKQRTRTFDEAEFKALLRLALANGWRPYPQRVCGTELRLDGDLDEIETLEIAAALERGLKRSGTTLPPPLMMALLETIGVLRHGPTHLSKEP